ncbi:MAG: class I SAM-dependent methyltransferase [Gordonia sp. (in: high G+C Gram-positive bacteria)]|uniref:class I SAM-dependent methyltransferase n=1 Tax=Gordonia sp. (in: high G+C Gram-positive bacteria) TaxID=84139 RepID=UPI0039E647BE
MSHDHPRTAGDWDDRYRSADRIWTSDANPALIRETADLAPGTALDVGSGEGADARWLADQGWTVVAVDISEVAVQRAADIDARDAISWVQADLTVDDVPGGPFDLIAVHYFPIAADDDAVVAKLVAALAPGGTLLDVMHAPEGVIAHGFDLSAFLQPADVAERFADQLDVEKLETVPRGRPAGGTQGAQHADDVVLKARRTSAP